MRKIIAILFIVFIQGCYFDKNELLNPPAISCDTTKITYSGTINPILVANCAGCHSGANAPLGIKLDQYNTVKGLATTGMLIGVITHAPGFDPMPKNGGIINDCSISKIRLWIAAGALNN